MKKAKILLFLLITLVMLLMVSCANSSTSDDNQPETPGSDNSSAPGDNQLEPEEIVISVDYAPADISGAYYSFDEEYTGYEAGRIVLSTNVAAKDFKFIEIGFREENGSIQFYEAAVLYAIEELSPDKPLVVTWLELGSIPHRGISFVDKNNTTRYFYIAQSGENGALLLVEFGQK